MNVRTSQTIELSAEELLTIIKHGVVTDEDIAIVMTENEYLNAVRRIELA